MDNPNYDILDVFADIESLGRIAWIVERGADLSVGDAIVQITMLELGNIEIELSAKCEGTVDQVFFSLGDKISPG